MSPPYVSDQRKHVSCAAAVARCPSRSDPRSHLSRRPSTLVAVILVTLLAVALCDRPAWAQVEPGGAPLPMPLDPDLAPRPSANAARATGPVRVDGVLDDATWAAAPVIDAFWQQKPRSGAPATERTEVRILFDDQNLYIGAEMHDQPGYRPIIPTLQRDPNTRDGDAFGIMFDPFLDGKTVFSFFFNPGGAVRDIQSADDGRINNAAWDAAFDLDTRVHDRGWTLEVAIPWSQLRFDAARAPQVWGMNMLRRIRRKNEDATWAPMDRQWQIYVSSRGGTLHGLDGLETGRNLSLKPFVLGSEPSGDLQASDTTSFEVGGDLKYGITPSMTLDLTLNTDFSQVEVDQEQVNLTRFSLFLPEKREFFLENAGVFQFGDQGTYSTRTGATNRDFTLFHSRRIGLTPRGSPLPILGGGRVSGTAGPVSVGVLNMQTLREGDFDPENFTVARVRTEPVTGLTLGGLFGNRATTAGGLAKNRSYGADLDFQALNGYLLVQSYVAATEGTDTLGAPVQRRMAGRLSAGWRDPFWEVFALYRHFDEDFAPGIGFVRRTAIDHGYATIGVRPRPDWPGVLEINPYLEAHIYSNLQGVLETRTSTVGLDFDFRDGSVATINASDRYEHVFESFAVRGSEVGAGRYAFREAEASYQTSGARRVSGRASVGGGGYFGGERFSFGGNVLGRVGHQVLLQLSADHNRIALPGQPVTTADVYGANLDVFFSTRLLTSAFVQYNAATEDFVTNLRFRWIHAPLSDLYLVLTERRDTATDRVLDRFLTLKFTKLLAF